MKGKIHSWDPETQTGEVHADGTIWRAISKDGTAFTKNEEIRIVKIDGLTLHIAPPLERE